MCPHPALISRGHYGDIVFRFFWKAANDDDDLLRRPVWLLRSPNCFEGGEKRPLDFSLPAQLLRVLFRQLCCWWETGRPVHGDGTSFASRRTHVSRAPLGTIHSRGGQQMGRKTQTFQRHFQFTIICSFSFFLFGLLRASFYIYATFCVCVFVWKGLTLRISDKCPSMIFRNRTSAAAEPETKLPFDIKTQRSLRLISHWSWLLLLLCWWTGVGFFKRENVGGVVGPAAAMTKGIVASVD